MFNKHHLVTCICQLKIFQTTVTFICLAKEHYLDSLIDSSLYYSTCTGSFVNQIREKKLTDQWYQSSQMSQPIIGLPSSGILQAGHIHTFCPDSSYNITPSILKTINFKNFIIPKFFTPFFVINSINIYKQINLRHNKLNKR